MKQIDLKSSEYRKQNPRTGAWQFRDNPRLCFVMMCAALLALAWIWSVRSEITAELLFGGVVVMAFGAGGMFAYWLKDY